MELKVVSVRVDDTLLNAADDPGIQLDFDTELVIPGIRQKIQSGEK